jgi:hypothetical protein
VEPSIGVKRPESPIRKSAELQASVPIGELLQAVTSSQSHSLRARRLQAEQARLQRVRRYRQAGDLAHASGNTAAAALNYRRAVTTGVNNEDGQAALAALQALHEDGNSKLGEVEQLVAQGEFDKASRLLRECARDYSELALSERIQQLRNRLARMDRPVRTQPQLATAPAADLTLPGADVPAATSASLPKMRRGEPGEIRQSLPAVKRLADRSAQPAAD